MESIEDLMRESLYKVDPEIIVVRSEDAEALKNYIADFLNKKGIKSAEYNEYVESLK